MIRSGVVGKTGRIRLKGAAMEALRRARFALDGWKCVVCGCEIRWDGWNAGHLAHVKSRGAGGSDTIENTVTKCRICHHAEHNPKAVPSKA